MVSARNGSSTRRRTNSRSRGPKPDPPQKASGADNTNGTPLLASTANPRNAETHGRTRMSDRAIQGSAVKIAAENIAVRGRSVTPAWLNPSQPAEVPRRKVANQAG